LKPCNRPISPAFNTNGLTDIFLKGPKNNAFGPLTTAHRSTL
jgi:hypothetical protein